MASQGTAAKRNAPKARRRAFAKRFAELMLQGASASGKSPGRWTDGKLASALTEAAGRPQHPFAPNTIGNWRKAAALPDVIAPLLEVFFGDAEERADERQSFQDLFSAAQLEKWGPLKAKATDRAAPTFIAQGKTHVIDRTPRPTDARAARTPRVQAQQDNVRRSAERLADNVESRGPRYSNTPIWRELAKEARRLAEIATLEPQNLITKLPDAYAASLYLGGRIDLDNRIDLGKSEDPRLDLDVRGDLVHLVQLCASWLRNYPSIRTQDDQAARSLTNFADAQPALDLIKAATQEGAILPEDAAVMQTLGEAAQNPEFLGQKAQRSLIGGAGNLALALGETEAERQAHALDLSNEDTRALAEATRAALIKAGPLLDSLSLPDDVRVALKSLTSEALARRPHPALPDNIEARARDLILKGVAPPAAWRQRIRVLDFSNTELSDAAPLAGLSALTSLILNGTKIVDAAPLAALTALTKLYLRDTEIADAAPLARLTTLTTLDLNSTKIADAAPLAGLTALTTLDLRNTQVADAAPLAKLTALTSLLLGFTKIADAAPLAGLTALTSLSLSNTQIADAAPLAGLTALRILMLGHTQIADAEPLVGLTALTWLDLRRTPIRHRSQLKELKARITWN